LERIPAISRDLYKSDFRLADDGFYNGRMETTSKKRNNAWDNWVTYVQPLGLDPMLQNTEYTLQVRALTGFAGRLRTGYYGRHRQITAPAVYSTITAIGTTIALATGINPTKMNGAQDKLIPRLSQMFAGWKKEDPPTMKKLPIGIDIPEYISLCGLRPTATERDRAAADLILVAFYYLLRIGEYTVKGARNNTKQTVQFRMQDVTFFRHDKNGTLRQLPRTATPDEISTAHSATLKLDNQKNGWKGVCIHQEVNGDPYHCPVKALGRRYLHIRRHTRDQHSTFLSTYFINNIRYDVTDKNISTALKLAGVALEYPSRRGIPIERIDTHSLRSGGANALALNGYSDREIQKMGRWRSATFKEYIREELSCYSAGMSTNMKRKFNFVNIAGGVYTDVTPTLIDTNYTLNTMAAEAA
jgi:hypothetical protein